MNHKIIQVPIIMPNPVIRESLSINRGSLRNIFWRAEIIAVIKHTNPSNNVGKIRNSPYFQLIIRKKNNIPNNPVSKLTVACMEIFFLLLWLFIDTSCKVITRLWKFLSWNLVNLFTKLCPLFYYAIFIMVFIIPRSACFGESFEKQLISSRAVGWLIKT